MRYEVGWLLVASLSSFDLTVLFSSDPAEPAFEGPQLGFTLSHESENVKSEKNSVGAGVSGCSFLVLSFQPLLADLNSIVFLWGQI